MIRRRGRDRYHPVKFNQFSADELQIQHHMDNIEDLRKKFIAMKNAKPIIINGRHRTFTVTPVNNPYIDVSDYYINTSQRQDIRDNKNKISLNKRKPITYIRYDRYDSRGRSGMRKPSKPKTTYKKHTPSKQRPRRQTTPRKQRPKN
jgi:hypothetical protein